MHGFEGGAKMRVKSLLRWWMVPLCAVAAVAAAPVNDLPLVEAVKSQNKEAVRALLKQSVDVNAPQADGATALHWAAYWDDQETASLLIRAGAAVNWADEHGVTPLWLACNNGSAPMVGTLLKAGANPNIALSSGETPLMTASRTGDAGAVRLLLAHGADPNAREGSRGQTALMWAVAQQHSDVVRALVEHGADIHARSDVRPQVVNTGGDGNNALTSGNPPHPAEIAQGGFTPLLFAAQHGDLDSARLLLEVGANVNDTAPAGMSALVVAAHSSHGALAAFLVDKGADANAADAGYTALHAAVLRGDLELVKALLAHGANPNAPLIRGTVTRRNSADWELGHILVGATPFWLAARFVEPGIMRVLAANGADPLFTKDGTTALMVAMGTVGGATGVDRLSRGGSNRGRYEIPPDPDEDERTLEAAELAIELGADVNAVDRAGDTALHVAAARRLNAVIELLANSGARLDVKNKQDQTPLAVAMAGGRRRAAFEDTAVDERFRVTADLLRKLGATE